MSWVETADAMDLPPRSCAWFLVQAAFRTVLASWRLYEELSRYHQAELAHHKNVLHKSNMMDRVEAIHQVLQ